LDTVAETVIVFSAASVGGVEVEESSSLFAVLEMELVFGGFFPPFFFSAGLGFSFVFVFRL
jgi:hypothetical protein